jgi:hypothetical protein
MSVSTKLIPFCAIVAIASGMAIFTRRGVSGNAAHADGGAHGAC